MAQELHPDKNNSPNAKDKFAEINKYISAYIVHMKSYRMRVREKTMITLDQQSRIPSLGFKIKIFLTNLDQEAFKEDEEGSSRPTWTTLSPSLKIFLEDPSMDKERRIEGNLIWNNRKIYPSGMTWILLNQSTGLPK